MKDSWYAYLLKLGDGFFYVGISRDPVHRLHAHLVGSGSKLSQRHGVQEILKVWNIGTSCEKQATMIENKITECMHYVYGDKVRGGSWCVENCYFGKDYRGWTYLNRFEDVTEEIEAKLRLVMLRGWG